MNRVGVGWIATLTIVASSTAIAGTNEWTSLGSGWRIDHGARDRSEKHAHDICAAAGNRVFRSVDGAASWTPAGSGLILPFFFPALPVPVQTLAINPRESSTLDASVNGRGLFKSGHDGRSWNEASSGLQPPGLREAVADVLALAIDPLDPNTLYAGTGSGVYVITFAEVVQ